MLVDMPPFLQNSDVAQFEAAFTAENLLALSGLGNTGARAASSLTGDSQDTVRFWFRIAGGINLTVYGVLSSMLDLVIPPDFPTQGPINFETLNAELPESIQNLNKSVNADWNEQNGSIPWWNPLNWLSAGVIGCGLLSQLFSTPWLILSDAEVSCSSASGFYSWLWIYQFSPLVIDSIGMLLTGLPTRVAGTVGSVLYSLIGAGQLALVVTLMEHFDNVSEDFSQADLTQMIGETIPESLKFCRVPSVIVATNTVSFWTLWAADVLFDGAAGLISFRGAFDAGASSAKA
jgi:hypothetical protein